MSELIRLLIVASLLMSGAMAMAQNDPVTMVTVAEKEVVYTDSQGIERTRLVPVATVIPGDQIVYTITFANKGKEMVNNINIVDPIPEQMRYVGGSAFGLGTEITFSADDGESFATPDDVMVVDTNGKRHLASPAQYTHIRWAFKNALEPSTQAYAQFKAVLK